MKLSLVLDFLQLISSERKETNSRLLPRKQIFKLCIQCEKYLQHQQYLLVSWCFKPSQPQRITSGLQHQQDLCHVFIDFKKTFDRVWHAALWATMKKCNISTNLIQVIKNLYNKAASAVLFNNSIGDWFRTTVGVR